MKNNILTASRLNCLLGCMRRHYWRYEVGLTQEQSGVALRFGSAWARAKEAYRHGKGYEDALAAAVPEGVDLDEMTVATISGLLAGYYQYYGPSAWPCNAEVEFSQPLAGSRTFTVAGKLDGLSRMPDGRLAIEEDKTTSDSLSDDSDYWLRLRFNIQLLQYASEVRKAGWDVSTVVYDVTRKPSIQPKDVPLLDDDMRKIVNDATGQRVFKKDGTPRESGDKEKGYFLQVRPETAEEFSKRLLEDTMERPAFYFARREVPILDSDLEEFVEQRLTLSRMILHCRGAEKRFTQPERAWPRNVSDMVCRSCEFFGFCLQNLSVDLNNPPTGFNVSDPSPELTPK